MRSFLAVAVRPPAQQPVAELIEGLRERVAGVRWVDTATTHITLHFFADLPGDRLREVAGAVRGAVEPLAGFPLRLGGLGSFPRGARARVLWLGLEEASPPLSLLAARVQAAVAACGFDLDGRRFRPHLTLGRPGPRFDLSAWRAQLGEGHHVPVFLADRVTLFESHRGHHVREVFPLRAVAREAG